LIELTWSDALALDIAPMDDTHREFVDLLASVAEAADGDLVAAWEALIDHTADHFAREDRWMQQTGFASVNCHTTQHQVVLSVMRDAAAVAEADRHALIRKLAHELALWFPSHAQTMDAALALHLRSVAFDFDTGRMREDSTRAAARPISGCGSMACDTP